MNIYVGNLDYKTDEKDLKNLFDEFGDVTEVKIVTDKYSGRSKGFAFVVMDNERDANKAIKELDSSTLGSRQIKVNEARGRKEFS